MPTLPLERKLPSPFSEAWLSFKTNDPIVSSQHRFATKHEKSVAQEEIRQKVVQRERWGKYYICSFLLILCCIHF
jgi:hypothetical protein